MRILTMYKGYKIFTHHGGKSVCINNVWHEHTNEKVLMDMVDDETSDFPKGGHIERVKYNVNNFYNPLFNAVSNPMRNAIQFESMYPSMIDSCELSSSTEEIAKRLLNRIYGIGMQVAVHKGIRIYEQHGVYKVLFRAYGGMKRVYKSNTLRDIKVIINFWQSIQSSMYGVLFESTDEVMDNENKLSK